MYAILRDRHFAPGIVPLVALASVVLSPSPAGAREFELAVGGAHQVMASPSLDAVSTDDTLAMSDLGAAVEVARHVPIADRLSLETRWSVGSTSALDFGLSEGKLRLQHLTVGARASREVYPRLRVHAHVGAGFAHGALSIHGASASSRPGLADSAFAGTTYAGAGVDLTLVRAGPTSAHPDLALAFRLEAGWQATSGLSFTARPEPADGDAATIDVIAAPLGTIETEGAVVRVGVVGRF
jgi:hypothetical protein